MSTFMRHYKLSSLPKNYLLLVYILIWLNHDISWSWLLGIKKKRFFCKRCDCSYISDQCVVSFSILPIILTIFTTSPFPHLLMCNIPQIFWKVFLIYSQHSFTNFFGLESSLFLNSSINIYKSGFIYPFRTLTYTF